MNHKNDEPPSNRTRGGWNSDQPITLMNSLFQRDEQLRRSHRLFVEPSLEDDSDSIEMPRRQNASRSYENRLRLLEVVAAACRLCDELTGDEPDDDSHDQMSD